MIAAARFVHVRFKFSNYSLAKNTIEII